ncbi:osmotically-inducible protein OsmY [Kribbella steppae]|uniref:Osmotically-inducible protein OsmY n=1 Tax=Kribbella steppae TaxID=2512223 RepID=A0A4R2H398_9ACTN|nr:BON domain-containing protein [Kribbella steppae]TCO19731.1 osmotically-inducible protein OsmY [Kribbella steppae]
MTNDELQLNVADELFWDPKVDSEAIAVSAKEGTVTLRGTVGSFRQKREAKKAAKRVYGVVYVDNELEVRILNEQRRDDADLRGDVLQALVLDSLVPSTVDAKVKDGFVTLTGSVDWQYQRSEAAFVAGNILGVIGVENDIFLETPTPWPADVEDSIKKAMQRDAKLDAENIQVETASGTATLTGNVRSWAEHDAAVAAAWAAPGVTDVNDRLSIFY